MWEDFDAEWHESAEEVMSGMKEWRLKHPRATLREIEDALDERLAKMRVRMLADTAMASGAAEMMCGEDGARLTCPTCGEELEARGKHERLLMSQYNQTLRIERRYGVCPQCAAGFFPSG